MYEKMFSDMKLYVFLRCTLSMVTGLLNAHDTLYNILLLDKLFETERIVL